MSDWKYGYLIAELHTGRYFKKDMGPLNVVTVGADKDMITTMGGLRIQPDISIEECSLTNKDLLILPGGNTWGEVIHEKGIKDGRVHQRSKHISLK